MKAAEIFDVCHGRYRNLYEPIVDMSDDHLKTLYNEVQALN